jgi:hypothetical protein
MMIIELRHETLKDSLGDLLGTDDEREVTVIYDLSSELVVPDIGPSYWDEAAYLLRFELEGGEVWPRAKVIEALGQDWVDAAENSFLEKLG